MFSPSKAVGVTAAIKNSARIHTNKAFVELEDNSTISYGEAKDRISRLAGGLRAIGLENESKIALMALNSHRYAEMYYAVPWAGCIVVPVNIRWSMEEIIFSFLDCGVECVALDDTFARMAPLLRAKVPTLKHILHLGNGAAPENCLNYEALMQENQPLPDQSRGGDDIYGIFYTGGTTGQSKGVMLTHGGIVLNGLGMQSQAQYTPGIKYLHCAPMFHLADSSQTFALTIAGGTHAFIPKFTPQDFLDAVSKYHFASTVLVPVMINAIVNFPGIESYDLSSIKSCLYGASPMSETLLLNAMKVFPNANWTQGYGMTETSPLITLNGPEVHVPGHPKMRAVGRPVPWAEACIMDSNDNEVPFGVVGEVCTRGGHVMRGYYNRPDLTTSAIRNGWMHTGDGGYMDEDGFIFLVDRMKDMIISGGENVYSAEVENVVMMHPSVMSVAVIGTPDVSLGELVTAIVVPKPGQQIDDRNLIDHCKAHIGGYKCPRKVIVRDSLPISGAGKILKHQLRKEFWGENQHVYATDDVHTSYQ
eukprot:c12395_g1_i4.p1 GENE.c12395_g1_i4~~c12395_g1_i4.p1  ORF type:complete len:548 (+),score=130.79 c12395_g1_i4:46-1644(+)